MDIQQDPGSFTYQFDCVEGMKQLNDKAFDLAIVDPPYGIKENAHRVASRGKLARTIDYGAFDWDNETPGAEYFQQLFRVSRNQIIWGGNYFLDHLSATPCFLIWDKLNGGNDFADAEIAWASFVSSVRVFRYRWNGMLQQDMANKEKRIHPTQKPVALYKWILKNYAKPGDSILDTHLGSGSSRIACHAAGLMFTGFENHPKHFADQEKRFAQYLQQTKIVFP